MIPLPIYLVQDPDKFTGVPLHLEEKHWSKGLCWPGRWQVRQELALGPASSFPPCGGGNFLPPALLPRCLPRPLPSVSTFGRLTPQLILCDPQITRWPETWVRQTLPELSEGICMVRPRYAHNSSCRFVGSLNDFL